MLFYLTLYSFEKYSYLFHAIESLYEMKSKKMNPNHDDSHKRSKFSTMEKIRLFFNNNGCCKKKDDSLEKYFRKTQERLEKELDLFNIVVAQRLLNMNSNVVETSSEQDQYDGEVNLITQDS